MNKSLKIFLFLVVLIGYSSYAAGQDVSDTARSTISLNLKNKFKLDTNNFNIFPKKFNNKKVALVLSGGGARGIAQLGVLQVFEENDIDIDLIAGTSIGSVIGGLYCSGNDATELIKTVKKIDWVNNLKLSDNYQRESLFLEQKERQDKSLITISLDGFVPAIPSSISSGHHILRFINLLFINSYLKPKNNFEDLKIPFISVTTDLDKGERFEIKSGNISEAVKASVTFPLVYSPTIIEGRNLVDGGLTSNIPVDVAKENGADYIIAVNSTSPLRTRDELNNPLNTADQIISITMAKLNELQLSRASIIITPDLGTFQASNFSNIDYLIDAGRIEALKKINLIKSGIDSIEQLSSSYYNNFTINARVRFETGFISDSIRNNIFVQQNNNFVRYTAIENTLKYLYKTGIYKNVTAEITRDNNGAIITYKLENNPLLEGIKINSSYTFIDSLISDYKINNLNENVNTKSLYKLYLDIYSLLRANNNPISDINRFYFNFESNELEIKITDGSIKDILIIGNKRTKNSVILREAKIIKNKIAYFNEFEETLSNIYSTNLFKQISIDFEYKNDSISPNVRINLIEKSSKNIRLAMRTDSERKLQIYVDLRDENLFGTGNELGINTIGGLRNRDIKLELKSNRFFNTFYTYNLNLFYSYKSIYSYNQTIDYENNDFQRNYEGELKDESYGLSFTIGKQLERLGVVYGQLLFVRLKTIDNFSAKRSQSEFNVTKLKFGGKIDTQNKIPFSMSGNIIDFYYMTAQDKLGGNVTYSVMNLRFEYFVTLNKLSILKPKFVFGFGDRTTPITELFSLGGENSFYGMVEDEVRGRQIFLTSLEFRYQLPIKLFFDTFISLRYDLGQVWQNSEDVRFQDLRHGLGLSLQFDTPVGKASFSGGRSFIINKGFTKDSFIWGPYTFYFSIGYDL